MIQEEIDELRSSKTSPVGLGDGLPHGSGTSDLSGYAARLDELMRELEAEKADGDLPGNPSADRHGSGSNRTGNPVQTLSAGTEMGENFCGNEL